MNAFSGDVTKFGRRTYESNDMLKLYDCTRMALWRRIRDGEVPAPAKFGRSNIWAADIVDKHLDNLFEQPSSRVT